jgi:O-antigen ligase
MWQIITSERIHKIFIRLNEKDLDWERIKVMGLEGYRTDVVSGALRITAWIDGVKLISNRPFLGYGYKLNYLYSNWQTSENYFLDIWIMIGVFGFMNILLIFLYLLKYSWRFLNSKNLYSYHYSRFYLSFLVSITVISLTGSVLFSPKLASYFWILNSLLLGLSNEKNSHSLT